MNPTVALFDLDHTLLPIDSDHAWGQFLVTKGIVDQDLYEQANNTFYQDYQNGTLNIDAFLEFALQPLAKNPRVLLDQWHAEFMQDIITPHIFPSAVNLVKSHLEQGHLCCIVTATNRFVTEPIAQRFGIDHLLATNPKVDANGEFTGAVEGQPNFQAGKIAHVTEWLRALGYDFSHLANSFFYSDSINDLPLLEMVKEPIATNPDKRLQIIAKARSWKMMHLF
jgi:HAD superfamily hydrolase (TIGR01490 family)